MVTDKTRASDGQKRCSESQAYETSIQGFFLSYFVKRFKIDIITYKIKKNLYALKFAFFKVNSMQ